MRKYITFFIVLCPLWTVAQALEIIRPDSSLLVSQIWRITFSGLGVQYETKFTKTLSIVSEIRMTAAAQQISYVNTAQKFTWSDIGYSINPYFSGSFRHYYNINKRYYKSKIFKYNSGNYIALRGLYIFPAIASRNIVEAKIGYLSGPQAQLLWGLQRTYRRNFYLNFSVGLGTSRRYTGIVGDMAIGYTFPNNRLSREKLVLK